MSNLATHQEHLLQLHEEPLSPSSNEAGVEYVRKMERAAVEISSRVEIPKTLLILGSGLGGIANSIENAISIPYEEIHGMPRSNTPGHANKLIVGKLEERHVAVFAGRVHCHDGLTPAEVAFGVRVMVHMGVENIIVTNAAGSVNQHLKVGYFMVITNHDSQRMKGDPSDGLLHPVLGSKFYAQTDPYDPYLARDFLIDARREGEGAKCHQGVYCFFPGPRYESRAEIASLAKGGVVSAVGMSTVPEVLAAAQMGAGKVRILGVSTITNLGAGIGDSNPNHEEVGAVGDQAGPRLEKILRRFLRRDF